MVLVNPRLTDYFGIPTPQAQLDFAIPFFNEDIPLYVDPFLLWASPSQQDQALHTAVINAFNQLGQLFLRGEQKKAVGTLIAASECDEVGLGASATRKGKRLGKTKAHEILSLFKTIPQYGSAGFRHFEEIQFFIDGISKDRISDITCSFTKSFLVDYTIEQCHRHGIPLRDHTLPHVYDYRKNEFKPEGGVQLPFHPDTRAPLILVPKRWLRFGPWISYDDYFQEHCPQDDISHEADKLERVDVLNFNRANYNVVDAYIREKERTFEDCKNDPLFTQIPVISARRKLTAIKKLPSGKNENADREYEKLIGDLFPSLLYPQLDFAAVQSRTDSGSLVRDLIFYNSQSDPFLKGIFDDYASRQLVFELKNVREVSRDHVNQLNAYMTDSLGKFGVLVTRNPLTGARKERTIDLWSGQRRSIITLTDADVEQVVELFESKQRLPIDVIKKKYIEFRRDCPS